MVLSSVALLNVIYSYIFRWMWHVLPPTRHYASWNLIWSDIVFHNVPSAQFGCQTKIPSYSKHIWRTRFSASHQHIQGMYIDDWYSKKNYSWAWCCGTFSKGEVYFQKTLQIIFLTFWQTFLNVAGFRLAAQLSQPIKSLEISKKFTKKAKIWFHEFFENTSPLGIINA